MVTPNRWRNEYSASSFEPAVASGLEGRICPLPIVLPGRPQRHFYLTDPMRKLRELRPRVVLCAQEPYSLAAAQWGLAAWRSGIPFGLHMDENLDRHLPTPLRRLRSTVLARAAFVATHNPKAASLARSWGATGSVAVVPYHVPPWPVADRVVSSGFVVGFAGRLVPEKGLDTLVAAVRRLEPPVELFVVGDGPLRNWLVSQDLGAASLRVVTDLPHARMSTAFAQMDVLVVPSRTTPRWSDQAPRVLVEALWCGTPVVGSTSGGIPWQIEVTGGGRLFAEGDDVALASVLAELRASPSLRSELARRGQVAVRRYFSVEAVADGLEQTLAHWAPQRHSDLPTRNRRPLVALVGHGIHDHGGMERACFELIRRLDGQVRFVVISVELAEELRPLVEQWIRVWTPMRPIPLKLVWFYVSAARSLARLQVDLVHSVGAIVPNRVDVAAVHLCHAGYVAATRSLAPPEAPPVRRLNRAVARTLALAAERWSYRRSRVRTLAPVSESVAEEVALHYPSVPRFIIPNGVDTDRFSPDDAVRRTVRAREGAGDDVIAIFVGGDWEHKGLGLIIEAAGLVRERGTGLQLWVVGSGNRARFARLARRHAAEHAVRFFGPRRDLADLYRGADVFVLCSLYETFSLAAFEAAATGLPILVTRQSGAAAALAGSGGGRIVERTPAAVSRALLELATDGSLRRELGDAARCRAKDFTWRKSAEATLALYRSILRVHGEG